MHDLRVGTSNSSELMFDFLSGFRGLGFKSLRKGLQQNSFFGGVQLCVLVQELLDYTHLGRCGHYVERAGGLLGSICLVCGVGFSGFLIRAHLNCHNKEPCCLR